ncbi:MAG: hypothetical protein ACKO63_07675, partial [Nodosilinea sp.]
RVTQASGDREGETRSMAEAGFLGWGEVKAGLSLLAWQSDRLGQGFSHPFLRFRLPLALAPSNGG